MLLTEDGHLDIKRVEMLNEEELHQEKLEWTEDQWYEWTHKDGSMGVGEFFNRLRDEIREMYADKNDY